MLNKDFLLKDNFLGLEDMSVSCPYCRVGILIGNNKTFIAKETQDSLSLHNHHDWDPDWIRENFMGMLTCNSCKENVFVSGTGDVDWNIVWIPEERREEGHQVNQYSPKFFNPCLQIIDIPEPCPIQIENILKQSFSLFWLDLDSCANKLRIALEYLMDDLKVKKYPAPKKGRKRRKLNLDERIKVHFAKKYPKLARLLLAVKWIGNEGSHIGGLIRKDLIDAYELIEHALIEIYDSKVARLQKMSKTINKTKKPLSKTKSRGN